MTAVSYATPDDLKSRLESPGAAENDRIVSALASASRAIDAITHRRFWADTVTSPRVFATNDLFESWIDDFWDTTGLIVETDDNNDGVFETTWATGDYQLEPLNGIEDGIEGLPFFRIIAVAANLFPAWAVQYGKSHGLSLGPHSMTGPRRRAGLRVTAKWGWAVVPDVIHEATLIGAAELWALKGAPFGAAGFGEYGVMKIRDNPKVRALVGAYSRAIPGIG